MYDLSRIPLGRQCHLYAFLKIVVKRATVVGVGRLEGGWAGGGGEEKQLVVMQGQRGKVVVDIKNLELILNKTNNTAYGRH